MRRLLLYFMLVALATAISFTEIDGQLSSTATIPPKVSKRVHSWNLGQSRVLDICDAGTLMNPDTVWNILCLGTVLDGSDSLAAVIQLSWSMWNPIMKDARRVTVLETCTVHTNEQYIGPDIDRVEFPDSVITFDFLFRVMDAGEQFRFVLQPPSATPVVIQGDTLNSDHVW